MSSSRCVLRPGWRESIARLNMDIRAAVRYLVLDSVTTPWNKPNNWLSTFKFSHFPEVRSLVFFGLPYRPIEGTDDSEQLSFLELVRESMPHVNSVSYVEVVQQNHALAFPGLFLPWLTLTCLSLTIMRFNAHYVGWMRMSQSTLTNITIDGQLQSSEDGLLALAQFFRELRFPSLKALNLGILSSQILQDRGDLDTEALRFIAEHRALTHLWVCGRQPHGSSASTSSSFFERIPEDFLVAATTAVPFLPNLSSFNGFIPDLAKLFLPLPGLNKPILPPSRIAHLSITLRGTDEPSYLTTFGAGDRPPLFNNLTFFHLDFLLRASPVSFVEWLQGAGQHLCITKDVKELSISSVDALDAEELANNLPFLEFPTLKRLTLRTTSTPFLFPGNQIWGPPDIAVCNQIFAQTLRNPPPRSTLEEIVLTSGNDSVINTILTVDQSSGTLRL